MKFLKQITSAIMSMTIVAGTAAAGHEHHSCQGDHDPFFHFFSFPSEKLIYKKHRTTDMARCFYNCSN